MIHMPTYNHVLSAGACEPPRAANDDLAPAARTAPARIRSGASPSDDDASGVPVAFVSYARCNRSAGGDGLERQHAGNLEAGLALPGRHVADFCDVGRVGAGFRDLLDFLQAGGARAVVVADEARLGRDMRDFYVNWKALARHASIYVAMSCEPMSRPVPSLLGRHRVLVALALSGSRPGVSGSRPGAFDGRL